MEWDAVCRTDLGAPKKLLVARAHWRLLTNTTEPYLCSGQGWDVQKIAKPIEMSFGWHTPVGPTSHVLHGVHIGTSGWTQWNLQLQQVNRTCTSDSSHICNWSYPLSAADAFERERVYLPQNTKKTYKIIVNITIMAGYQTGKPIKLVAYSTNYINS